MTDLRCAGCTAETTKPNDVRAWTIDQDGTWCGNCADKRDREGNGGVIKNNAIYGQTICFDCTQDHKPAA